MSKPNGQLEALFEAAAGLFSFHTQPVLVANCPEILSVNAFKRFNRSQNKQITKYLETAGAAGLEPVRQDPRN